MTLPHRTLYFFNHDLRYCDNQALHAAAQRGSVLIIFIDDRTYPHSWSVGSAGKVWLHHALKYLSNQLPSTHKNAYYRGDPIAIISRICQQNNIDAVMWNSPQTPWANKRDQALSARLANLNIAFTCFKNHTLWPSDTILKDNGTPYQVFTPVSYTHLTLPTNREV